MLCGECSADNAALQLAAVHILAAVYSSHARYQTQLLEEAVETIAKHKQAQLDRPSKLRTVRLT